METKTIFSPKATQAQFEAANIPYADAIVEVSEHAMAEMRRVIAALFRVAHTDAYAEHVGISRSDSPMNYAAVCGYDFHIVPEGPKLIEINTNAGGLMLAAAPKPGDVANVFVREFQEMRGASSVLRAMAICDENPASQFLFPEFLRFKEALEEKGITAFIADTNDLHRADGKLFLRDTPIDLVYLRDTDFTLQEPRSGMLHEAYEAGEVVVTPSPKEYVLLSDKRRLVTLSSDTLLRGLNVPHADIELFLKMVPTCWELTRENADELWKGRKNLVFKPPCGYASKQVYRGDKITRGKFESILDNGFVAQRYVASGVVDVQTPEGARKMKYDIRIFAYRDEILGVAARVYEGQVTTLKTKYGGFASVHIAANLDKLEVQLSI